MKTLYAKETSGRAHRIKSRVFVLTSALFGCAITCAFPQFSLSVPDYARASGLPESLILFSDTVKSAGIVCSMLVSGFAYRRLGLGFVFLTSLAATVLPQFIIPHCANAAALLGLKFFQGVSALIFPVLIVLIMRFADERDRGLATALFNGIFYAGGGLGATFAGFVSAAAGWMGAFKILGLVMLAAGLCWAVSYRVTEKSRARSMPAARNLQKPPVRTAKKARAARGDAMKIALLAVALFAFTFANQGVAVDMPLFANFLGYGAESVAKISIGISIAMLLGSVLSGKLSDRMAEARTGGRLFAILPGYASLMLGSILLALSDGANHALFVCAAFTVSFASCWGLGAVYPLIPDIFGEESAPIATGVVGGVGDIGMPLAPLVIGVCFGARGAWFAGWLMCLLFAAVSLCALLALRRLSFPPS
jgi:MFS family permease